MKEPSRSFEDLVDLIHYLREECPWDRKQTHDSIKDNLIEEAYEVVDAIDKKEMNELRNELGDLLLQVIFHSRMASETEQFDLGDVIQSISEKMIRRHPHIFSDSSLESESEVAEQWEEIKLHEGKTSTLDGLPPGLPALIRAKRMQEKASNVGFDWPDWELAWAKLDEELDEWKASVTDDSHERQLEEFGDLIFSMVNVGRLLNLDAEAALRTSNRKFETRFRYIEEKLKQRGKSVRESALSEMDELWEESKTNGR